MQSKEIQQFSTKNNFIKTAFQILGKIFLRLLPFMILIAVVLWLFNTIFPNGFNQIFGGLGTLLKNIGNGIMYPATAITDKMAKVFPNVSPKFWAVVKTLFTGGLIVGGLLLIVTFTPLTLPIFAWVVILMILTIALWNAFSNDNTVPQKVINTTLNKTAATNINS